MIMFLVVLLVVLWLIGMVTTTTLGGALHILLVALSLAGLGLTGLAIDVIRHHVENGGAAPEWPLGLAPPASWTAMQTVATIGRPSAG